MTTLIEGLRTRLKIGMEVHVELATRTKMWTGAPNLAHPDHFEAAPNTLLDPVVIGLPGSLPVANAAAVEMSVRVGLALGCQIARFTKWDRKSYYYPDLPKNYQISQYDLPLCGPGVLEIPVEDDSSGCHGLGVVPNPCESAKEARVEKNGQPVAPRSGFKRIRITRAHLEEDAGKLLHEAPGGRAIDYSIVDLNRAGTPLLEIVTEPDFTTADQCVAFGQTLRNICRFLGVSEGIMQKGHMRFEPNINVIIEKDGREFATPVVEIKNLNSFRSLHDSILYEHQRQVEQWLDDGKVMGRGVKSTRGWDDVRGITFLQREKEDAHDYRYFPDPDLVPVVLTEAQIEGWRAGLPELPPVRERRYIAQGVNPKDARAIVEEREVCCFFEEIVKAGVPGKRAASILLNNLARRANERGCQVSDLGIGAGQIAAIEKLSGGSKISSNGADALLGLCCEQPGADPVQLAEQEGLMQVSDAGALDAWVEQAMAAHPQAVEEFKAGKAKAVGAIVGAVMKLSGGKANPKAVQDKLREKLN